MSLSLEQTIKNFLSPNEQSRKYFENLLNTYFNSMQISDLSTLYSGLKLSTDNNIRIYLSILIKNFIEQKITSENKDTLISYISDQKFNILDIIFIPDLEQKTVNLLLLSFCKALSFFEVDISNYYNIIYELFTAILQVYSNQKNSQNISNIFRALYICYKFIKYIEKNIIEKKLEIRLKLLNEEFYNNILVNDYEKLLALFIKQNNDIHIEEYLILFLKVFKYSLNFLEKENRNKILESNYNLLVFIMNNLLNISNINCNLNINNNSVNFYFEIIFLCNEITIKYVSTKLERISLNVIKKYTEYFYIFIINQNLLQNIHIIFSNYHIVKNNKYNESKFLLDITDYLYRLIKLVFFDIREFGETIMIHKKKNYYKESNLTLQQCNDYLLNNYIKEDNSILIINFILKNYLEFTSAEISIAREDPENFFLSFTSYSEIYNNLKDDAGKLCNLLYIVSKNNLGEVFKNYEKRLGELTLKELILINNSQNLPGNELNEKCGLLMFFYYIENYFDLNNKNDQEFIQQIFLEELASSIVSQKLRENNEILSTFIIIKILTNIVEDNFDRQNDFFKKKILKLMLILFCETEVNKKKLLLDLAAIDLICEYLDNLLLDEQLCKKENEDNIFSNDLIQKYFIKISQLLISVSSPDLQLNVIETTKKIVNYINVNNLIINFKLIIPCLRGVWLNSNIDNCYNTKNEVNIIKLKNEKEKSAFHKNKNKIYIIRNNLLKLLNILIKKLGLFSNKNLSHDDYNELIAFIKEIIFYLISLKQGQTEEIDFIYGEFFNLIILLQNDYAKTLQLDFYDNVNSLINNIDQKSQYFLDFCQIFQILGQILEILYKNLNNNNQYFLIEFFIVEQFISFSFIKVIGEFLDSINFIDKIIFIFKNIFDNNILMENYFEIFFNIIEYIYYIIYSFSTINQENKNKLIDFIYQIIQSKLFFEQNNNTFNFNILFGCVQLSSRLIFANACNNIISDSFNVELSNKIIFLYNNNKSNFNSWHNNKIKIGISNLLKIINREDLKIKLKEIYNEIAPKNKKQSNFDKVDKHWLYYFNKLCNKMHIYHFCKDEDYEEFEWTGKFEKNQIFYEINSDFYIKYFFLKSDKMIINI